MNNKVVACRVNEVLEQRDSDVNYVDTYNLLDQQRELVMTSGKAARRRGRRAAPGQSCVLNTSEPRRDFLLHNILVRLASDWWFCQLKSAFLSARAIKQGKMKRETGELKRP